MNRQYYILTYGCQMNKNDSERIAGLLNSLGMKAVDKPEMADLLIINTCSVRQSAEDRVFGMIKNWQELRKNRPNLLIAITGCMPGRDKNGSVRKKIAGVDLFFAIEELPLLPNWLGELGFEGGGGYTELSPARFCQHKAFVTIQTGCDNFCTYCVVPYSRGREKNRRVAEILNETRKAVSEGAKEVVLLGQVVNHYIAPDPENFSKKNIFKAKDDFSALLWEINQLDGVERINWTAPDPQYFNDYQVEALKLSKQMNYLHLPVQSGDNEILKKMNRHYTREQYIDLVKKIRAVRPDVAIGTDIIVGFCGETEGQFQNTVELYKQCEFDIAFLAKYSERSGTAAAKAFKDDVARNEKKQRWQSLQDLMEKMTFEKNQRYARRVVSVLADNCEEGVCVGNSNEMKLTQFLGTPDLVGEIVDVEIAQAQTWILKGKIKK